MLTVYNFIEDMNHLTNATSHIIREKVEDIEQIDLVSYFLQRTAVRFFTLGALPNSASAWETYTELQKYKRDLLSRLGNTADIKELPKDIPVVRFNNRVTEYLIQLVTMPHVISDFDLSEADEVKLQTVKKKASSGSTIPKQQKELLNVATMTAPNKKALEYAEKLNIRFG